MKFFLLLCGLLLLPGTGHAQVPKGKPCAEPVTDSLRFQGSPVYRECDVEQAVRRTTLTYPERGMPSRIECVKVDLRFIVDSAGTPRPETASVLKTNAAEFSAALIASLAEWQYEPARLDGRPVAQVVVEHHEIPNERAAFVLKSRPSLAPARPKCR